MNDWLGPEATPDGGRSDQTGGSTRSRPKQPFLRRGEGVARRLTAYQRRKPSLSGAADGEDAAETNGRTRDCGEDSAKAPRHQRRAPARHGWSDQLSPSPGGGGDSGSDADAPARGSPTRHATRRGWTDGYGANTGASLGPSPAGTTSELTGAAEFVGVDARRREEWDDDCDFGADSGYTGPSRFDHEYGDDGYSDGEGGGVGATPLSGGRSFDWERGGGRGDAGGAAQAKSSPWDAREAEEALELEEFRALEQEILSSGTGAAAATGRVHSGPTHSSAAAAGHDRDGWGSERADGQRQWGKQDPAADREQGDASEDWGAEEEGDAHASSLGGVRTAVAAAAVAGQEVDFGDESEWVDTEFSFGQLPSAPQQQPSQPQAHSQQQPQGAAHEPAAPAGDAGMAQPFVRSLYQQAKAARAPPAAAAARPGSARPGSARGSGKASGAAQPGAADRAAPTKAAAAAAAAQDGVGDDINSLGVEELRARLREQEARAAAAAKDRAALLAMRNNLERAAARLETERRAWEMQRAEEQAALEAAREDAAKRLARERRVLEKQSKALLKLPTKKERSAIEALEAQLAFERNEARAVAARHRLTVDRLRCQVKSLQDKNAELREEVRWLEQQQIAQQAPTADAPKAVKASGATAPAPARSVAPARTSAATTAGSAAAARPAPGARLARPAAVGAARRGGSGELLEALFGAEQGDGAGAAGYEDDYEAEAEAAGVNGVSSSAAAGGRVACMPNGATVLTLDSAAAGPATARAGGRAPARGAEPDWGDAGADDGYGSGDEEDAAEAWEDSFDGGQRTSEGAAAGLTASGKGIGGSGFSFPGAAVAPTCGSPQPPAWAARVSAAASQPPAAPAPAAPAPAPPQAAPSVTRFPNGTVKVMRPDGGVEVSFLNGDLKRSEPGGRVDYYYAEVGTWQVSHPGGVEVFYFPSGQREAHHPCGTKEIVFADGGARRVLPGGAEVPAEQRELSPLVRLPPPAPPRTAMTAATRHA